MKRIETTVMCAVLFVLVGTLSVHPQGVGARKRLELVYGPRVGVTYIVADPEAFDESLQQLFPDSGREYFPIVTQFGVSVEQRIRLGETESHFAFQEIFLIGGLDQNIVIPSLSVLIGFRSRAGLELGLGPNLSMKRSGEEGTGAGVSVVYAVGWTFAFDEVYVPVNLAIVPTPSDRTPRISLLTGFNFGRQKR
jgi:hypothetical protein